MWSASSGQHLSHDRPCSACGHAAHTFLPCSDSCACVPPRAPGSLALAGTEGVFAPAG